jgi:hypothetical protein
MCRAVVDKDLYGAMISTTVMSDVRSQALQYSNHGFGLVDIIIRNVDCQHGFPEIIVDHGGEILDTYRKAVEVLIEDKEQKKRDREYVL